MSIKPPSANPALPRLHNIQALRGIAAMAVVIAHLFIMEVKYSPDQVLGKWTEYGGIGVDLFFVISGFIMVYVTGATEQKRGVKGAGTFLFARLSRIYPLYWLVSFALIGLYILRPDMISSSQSAPPNIPASLLLIPHGKAPLLAVGWTLMYELFFYLVFALSLFLSRRFLPWFLAIWAFITLGGYYIGLAGYGQDLLSLAPLSIAFSPLNIEFIVGASAALLLQHESKIAPPESRNIHIFLAAIATLSLGLTIGAMVINDSFIIDKFSRRVLAFCPMVYLMVFSLARLDLQGVHMPKPLRILGDWSYAIYLTHVLTLTVIGRIWKRFNAEGPLDNILVLIVMIIAVITVGGLTYVFFERPMLKAAKRLRARIFK